MVLGGANNSYLRENGLMHEYHYGIWRSTNYGASFELILPVHDIGYREEGPWPYPAHLRYQPEAHLWVALFEDSWDNTSKVWYSFDDGNTWTNLPVPMERNHVDCHDTAYLDGVWWRGGNVGGPLKRSDDNGQTWKAIWAEIDPDNPDITTWDDPDLGLFAYNYAGDYCKVNGDTILMEFKAHALISKDLGETWTWAGGHQIGKYAGISPDGKNIIMGGYDGFAVGGYNIGGGVMISRNAGDSWSYKQPNLIPGENECLDRYCYDLNITKIFGLDIAYSGYGGGFYISNWKLTYSPDGGNTWQERFSPFPLGDNYYGDGVGHSDEWDAGIDHVMMSGNGNILYFTSFSRGIYKSLDTGYTWELTGLPAIAYPDYMVTNYDGSKLFCGTSSGIYESNGTEWVLKGKPDCDIFYGTNAIISKDGQHIFAQVKYDGKYMFASSHNGGAKWELEDYNWMDTNFWKEEKSYDNYGMSDDGAVMFVGDGMWSYIKKARRVSG
jgi:hypothetical protein